MFDFSEFIKSCVGLSYLAILKQAEDKVAWAESLTKGGQRGAPKFRADGANKFAAEIKSFLFYMRYGTEPATGSFSLYRPVVQSLVDSGEFKAEALNAFNRSSST